jgi:hypothetical protein
MLQQCVEKLEELIDPTFKVAKMRARLEVTT